MDITTDYPARVAAVVQEAMTATHITRHKLAELSSVARMTLSRRLEGLSPFTVTELAAIAPHLGMTVTDIHRAAERRAA